MKRDQLFDGKDGSFHYIDWGGNGPRTHFSHATGLCACSYTPLVSQITRQVRVIGMDDRGHGKTTAPAEIRKLKNWGMFKSWQKGFLEAYLEDGIQEKTMGGYDSPALHYGRPDVFLLIPTISGGIFLWFNNPFWLFMVTTSDTFLPSAVRRFQSKLPHARVSCFQNTSHFVPMEKPAETALVISAFIAEHAPV